jgi:OmpA-OmpF porin, OOP family
MKYKQSFQIILALSFLLAAAVAASPAQATSHPGYVYSTDGKTPVRDADGHCVRTYEWRKEYATPECNPELLPAPKAAAPAPAPVSKKEGDSDGDGVPDSLDKCPDTPAGVKVDSNGCPLDSDHDGVPDYLDKCPDTPAGVKVDSNGCPLDSDHDGVPDYLDKCPDTPAGVKVDSNGRPLDSDHDGVPDYLDKCPDTPAGVKVDSNGCPLDSDHDGVPDYLDKCPDTPAGVKVDSSGCPLDSDHDGVPDYLDKCPDTPSGSRVDKDGCVEAMTLFVHFDTAKWIVKKEFYPEIEKFAAYLNRYPNVKAEIQGYTDNVGDPKKNVALSQHRAKAIMDELVKKYKIDPARLSAKGYGAANPIAPNDTNEGREKNRRVEAVIIK